MRLAPFILAVCAADCAAAKAPAEAFHLIAGRVPLDWRGPDGNTVVLDAPGGLIVVDTGRSPTHVQAILDYAKAQRRSIAAIVNSHGTSIIRRGTTTSGRLIRRPRSMRREPSRALSWDS